MNNHLTLIEQDFEHFIRIAIDKHHLLPVGLIAKVL